MSFKGTVVVSVKENSYRVHFQGMDRVNKDEAVRLMKKSNLNEKCKYIYKYK